MFGLQPFSGRNLNPKSESAILFGTLSSNIRDVIFFHCPECQFSETNEFGKKSYIYIYLKKQTYSAPWIKVTVVRWFFRKEKKIIVIKLFILLSHEARVQ